MATQHDVYDDLLMTLASRHRNLPELLRTLFSFLHRRTDFYVIDDSATRRMGFKTGAAERQLLEAFRSFSFKSATPTGPTLSPSRAPDDKPKSRKSGPAVCSDAATTADRGASTQASPPSITSPAVSPPPPDSFPQVPTGVPTAPAVLGPAPVAELSASASTCLTMRYTPTGAQVPIGNGGCGPDHWWTQSLTEATLYVPLPPGVVARDLAVDVSSLSLRVACRAGDAGTAVLLEGRFPYPVKASEAVWCVDHDPATRGQRPLDPGAPEAAASSAGKILVDAPDGSAGATLVVTLEKVAPTWWRSGLAGAPEIDATLVDSTVPLGDYDDETQAAIRRIMFDQAQKSSGLPTSEEELAARALGGGKARGR